jgi:micrococcal nuclease
MPTQVPAVPTLFPGETQEALVLRVVDGDTIVVQLDGRRQRVRYIGVDTPETHHPTDGADHWGFEASEANQAMVQEGSVVVLQRDISETDIYGRLLRYIWVDDTLVNAELVRAGLARVLFYEPDVLYKREIMAAEDEAKAARRGLYGPPPTPPAVQPLLYKGTAWTAAPENGVVPLWPDPARGDPEQAFPAGVQVRVADAFWVPERQEWWYWVGVNGFNGWTTGEHIQREKAVSPVDGPAQSWKAYDWLETTAQVAVQAAPGEAGEVVSELGTGAPVQVKGLSWDETAGIWWYYIEAATAEGWVLPDSLSK